MVLALERRRSRGRPVAEHEHDPRRGHRRWAEHRRCRGVWELCIDRDACRVRVWGEFAAVEVYSE